MRVRRHETAASEPHLRLVGAARPRDRHRPRGSDRGRGDDDRYGDTPAHVVLHFWIEPAIRRGRLRKGAAVIVAPVTDKPLSVLMCAESHTSASRISVGALRAAGVPT